MLSSLLRVAADIGTRFKSQLGVSRFAEVTRRCSSHSVLAAKAVDTGTCLEVQHPRWPHSLRMSYPWLRDHCRCALCYNHTTAQRSFDVGKLLLNIRPASVVSTPEGLELTWPDGHKTSYDYKFLWQNTYEACRSSYKKPHLLWTASTFPKAELTTVPLSEVECSSKRGVEKVLRSIVKHGFACISEVPPDAESTRSAIEKVCAIKKTFFGDVWVFHGGMYDHDDTAYSLDFIGAHTDTTYFSQPCRIQVFHCLQPASEGGESLLVDGFSVAEQFQTKHPRGYDFLSFTSFPTEFKEEGHHYAALNAIFKHNPVTGNICQFRHNVHDRAPLSSVPLEKMQEFYSHYSNFIKIVQNPRNEQWLQLQPGTVILIDNWRLMHGRNSYTGTRVMSGCYLDNEDFTSVARVLGVQLE